jgi:hypothetical protein
MTLDSLLGWSILLALLLALSAAVVSVPLRRLERALAPGRPRWFARGLAIGGGALLLWHALPLAVQAIYRWL